MTSTSRLRRVVVADLAILPLAMTGYATTTTQIDASAPAPGSTTAPLNKTHADNLRAQFLVGNHSDAAGDLDPTAPHNLVSSPTDISNVVSSPVRDVNTQGWDGIAVDFDSIQSQAAQGLVNFV
jgi:spore germination protein YaaH